MATTRKNRKTKSSCGSRARKTTSKRATRKTTRKTTRKRTTRRK